MSSLKKIQDLEVIPPAGAWKNIAKELDNFDQLKNVAKSLNSLEAAPPPGFWAGLSEKLNETDHYTTLANKLYNIEATPPPGVWGAISNELYDQKALEIIEKKLANLEAKPPAVAWLHIKDALEQKDKHPTLVVPMHHTNWLKYAAAACFIAIISVTAFFIFSDNDSSVKGFAGNSNKPSNSVQQASNNANNALGNNQPGQLSTKDQAMAGIRTKLGNAYTVSNEKNSDLQNRYIILMTQDGNVVRMSKKVGNMADCIAGEDNSCDEQITQWQKEMATNATTASPDNFLDILDMASNEKEVQQPKGSNM